MLFRKKLLVTFLIYTLTLPLTFYFTREHSVSFQEALNTKDLTAASESLSTFKKIIFLVFLFYIPMVTFDYTQIKEADADSLDELNNAIKEISQGNTEIKISEKTLARTDEFGELGRNFQELIDKFNAEGEIR